MQRLNALSKWLKTPNFKSSFLYTDYTSYIKLGEPRLKPYGTGDDATYRTLFRAYQAAYPTSRWFGFIGSYRHLSDSIYTYSDWRLLTFTTVKEGEAIYHLATISFDDKEMLRFSIDLSDGTSSQELTFQQKMYEE